MAAALGTSGIHPVSLQTLEFSGVFRGRELTRKDRRLGSNLLPINDLLGGGIPRGRISEIVGPQSSGKTSIAASFIAAATQRGETVAVVDLDDAFDPLTMAAAGVDLNRVLWVAFHANGARAPQRYSNAAPVGRVYEGRSSHAAWRAGELILEAGGFGLMVLDFGGYARSIPQSAALRLARLAERSGTSVLVLALRRMCGTFAALGLALSRSSALFDNPGQPASQFFTACGDRSSQTRPAGATWQQSRGSLSPAGMECRRRHGMPLFDGFEVEALVARNKLGGSGGRGRWCTLIDPSIVPIPSPPNRKTQPSG
jgi:hypothetical protein